VALRGDPAFRLCHRHQHDRTPTPPRPASCPVSARGAGFGLLDDGVACGTGDQSYRQRPARATSIRAVWTLDVVSLVALAIAVQRLQTDTTGPSQTPREEPVPENL